MRLVAGAILNLLLATFCVGQQVPVEAVIAEKAAWTGEGVRLLITLYSPGPFSGTAAFEFPELPRTVFLSAGNPVVGSEDVDDESYLTQRHDFRIFTQNSGEIVIPPFRVRFAGKKSFTSDPEPIETLTPELRFQSNRPPGTEEMGIVISATRMGIQQTWNPEPTVELEAGDVVHRTIVRTAEGTTAMMLPPVNTDAPDGARVYLGSPEVQDKSVRGESSSHRTDLVKYQFERAGSYTLPALTFVWWDPRQEVLQSKSLPEETVQVLGASPAAESSDAAGSATRENGKRIFVGLVVLAVLGWGLYRPLRRWLTDWLAYYNRPDALAVRTLRKACSSDDAPAAYAAMLSWYENRPRQVDGPKPCQDLGSFLAKRDSQALGDHWQALSRYLYSPASNASKWHGAALWTSFAQMRRDERPSTVSKQPGRLPALNPRMSQE